MSIVRLALFITGTVVGIALIICNANLLLVFRAKPTLPSRAQSLGRAPEGEEG